MYCGHAIQCWYLTQIHTQTYTHTLTHTHTHTQDSVFRMPLVPWCQHVKDVQPLPPPTDLDTFQKCVVCSTNRDIWLCLICHHVSSTTYTCTGSHTVHVNVQGACMQLTVSIFMDSCTMYACGNFTLHSSLVCTCLCTGAIALYSTHVPCVHVFILSVNVISSVPYIPPGLLWALGE